MTDDELRRLLRERDEAPGDAEVARRAAAAAGRTGERAVAAEAWQEVLRRAPRDSEAERRLAALGCEVLWRRRDDHGRDELESAIDGSLLVESPSVPGVLVARRPVTYAQLHRFLSREGGAPESRRWLSLRAPIRRTTLAGVWSLRGEAAETYVLEASWLGASAYARWAGGRLLRAEEWERLARAGEGLDGFDLADGEWVMGHRGPHDRPAVSLRDPRVPGAREATTQWYPEDACPAVTFRYARDSWFAPPGGGVALE